MSGSAIVPDHGWWSRISRLQPGALNVIASAAAPDKLARKNTILGRWATKSILNES